MKFVSFRTSDGIEQGGLLTATGVMPVAEKEPLSLLDFIQTGSKTESLVENGRKEYPLHSVELIAPIPRPAKNVLCVGRNYHDHVEEGDKVYGEKSGFAGVSDAPIFFTKPATSVIGSNAPIIRSRLTNRLDYEVELGVVIGKAGINILEKSALDHVWGYTVINDVTARDLQDRHKQWFKGKGLDTFCPMGPWLVYRDEIEDPHNLDIRLTVNGELRQTSNTRAMIFDIRRIIAELSAGMTLEPGDVIATGTCSGCAFGMTPPKWLQPGDVVEATIERIGTLRNVVQAE